MKPYRVMRLVFPTLWSPRSTIFVRLGGAEEKSVEAGVDEESISCVVVGSVVEVDKFFDEKTSSSVVTNAAAVGLATTLSKSRLWLSVDPLRDLSSNTVHEAF
jgi:hypothetical protein